MELEDYVTSKDELGERNLTVNLNAENLRKWKDRATESLPEFDNIVEQKSGALKAMTDATAAYLVVKVCQTF